MTWVIMTRSKSLYAALIGGCIALVYVFANKWWIGEWQGSVQAVTNSLVLMFPGVIFAAAVDRRQFLSKDGSGWMSIGFRPLTRTAAMVGALSLPGVGAITALLLAVGGYSFGISSFHFPGLWPLLLPYAWLAMFVGIGMLMGRYVPLIGVAPLCVVVGFIVPIYFAGVPDTYLSLLSPVDDGAISPPIFLRPEVVVSQLGLCLVASLLCAALAVRESWVAVWRRVLPPLLAAAVLLAAITFAVGPERRYQEVAAAGPQRCDEEGAARVCVWPDHSRLLAPALEAWQAILEILPSAWEERPGGFIERGLDPPENWGTFTTGTAHAAVGELALAMADHVINRLFCPDGQHVIPNADVAERKAWLVLRLEGLPEAELPPDLRRITSLSLPEQEAWWLGVESEAFQCALG